MGIKWASTLSHQTGLLRQCSQVFICYYETKIQDSIFSQARLYTFFHRERPSPVNLRARVSQPLCVEPSARVRARSAGALSGSHADCSSRWWPWWEKPGAEMVESAHGSAQSSAVAEILLSPLFPSCFGWPSARKCSSSSLLGPAGWRGASWGLYPEPVPLVSPTLYPGPNSPTGTRTLHACIQLFINVRSLFGLPNPEPLM